VKRESSNSGPVFDTYAQSYDRALAQGISVSGEEKEYFAEGRVRWLAGRLRELGERPRRILDFGCGTGTGARFLGAHFSEATVLGVDVSGPTLETARCAHGTERVRFCLMNDYQPGGDLDLAFCNGVFHHIPPASRADAVGVLRRSLRPGGVFAFWENNSWNPGTRYVMSRIPFDHDAITLTPPEARRLLSAGGFEVLRTDFLFVFPRVLGWLRVLEPRLACWPLGAQYLVLCRNACADQAPICAKRMSSSI
jgi:SAM-dependent methyltransferase